MIAPFLICALPRSRTAWCSEFLSYADWTCGHETLITMRSIEDVRAFFAQPNTGTVDTPAAPGWELLRHYVPDLRTVVIRRPVEDVVQSFLKLDLRGLFTYPEVPLRAAMTRADRALDRVASQPGVLTIEYADLANEDACRGIWHHCLPYRFDADWWAHWDSVNVQMDVANHVKYYHANLAAIERFKGLCKAEMWRLVRAGLIARKEVAHALD